MGPVIQAGCGALCPSHGLPCDGCRGSTLQPAYQQQVDLMIEKGATTEEITRYLLKFCGEDPEVKNYLLKIWSNQDKSIVYGENE